MQVIGALKTVSLLVPVLLASAGVLFFCMLDAVMKAQALAMGAQAPRFGGQPWGCLRVRALLTQSAATGNRESTEAAYYSRCAYCLHDALPVLSLTQLPLAQAVGLSFVAPIIALYLAAPMLGEQITRGAKIAAVLGFGGVVVIAGEDMFQMPMTAVC